MYLQLTPADNILTETEIICNEQEMTQNVTLIFFFKRMKSRLKIVSALPGKTTGIMRAPIATDKRRPVFHVGTMA
jgi:hypothetical protein